MLDATLVNVMMEFKNGRGLVNFLLSVRIIALRGPSGKNLDPWPFLVLINDLYVDNLANVRKYVDDMTVSEVVAKGNRNCTLEIAHRLRSGLRRIESTSIARNVRRSGYLL